MVKGMEFINFPMRKGWQNYVCSASKREDFRMTKFQSFSPIRKPTKMEKDFLQEHVVIGQGGMESNWNRMELD